MTNPIQIIPWQDDFITGLGNWLARRSENKNQNFSDQIIVFPHNRPARYLREFFACSPEIKRPCLLPETLSFTGFVTMLRSLIDNDPPKRASRLDRVGLLLSIVNRLRESGSGLISRLPEEPERFLPWGMRLADLMEEFQRQDLKPANLEYMRGEVADWAAALLENLEEISDEYRTGLETSGLGSDGQDCRFVLDHLDEIIEHLSNKKIIIAGFYALSGTENKLLHGLWQAGLVDVVWHTDPALAENRPGHWCLTEHRAWKGRWHARTEIAAQPSDRLEPELDFVEGFDLHSQLRALQDMLALEENTDSTAVVLPETGALIPVLHHLPEADLNISMGYPLARTPLYLLLENVMSLRLSMDESGRVEWKTLLDLIRHPYLRMLELDGNQPLRSVFRVWEMELSQDQGMVDPLAWTPPYGLGQLEELPDETGEIECLRKELLDRTFTIFKNISTLEELGRALLDLCHCLRSRGESLWQKYLVDAEYLARLMSSVGPELISSGLSQEMYPSQTLFAILRELCKRERVSFEPEPLAGLQVMGMLETRLLRFRRIFMLDAVEEKIPGVAANDPLLPDTMRHMLGLPDSRHRDKVAAYNFHRLLMGADKATLLYQSGIQPGLLDSKSVRSRFVEQLLWDREQKSGKLIEPGQPPLTAVNFPVNAIPAQASPAPVTEAIARKLEALALMKGLSASALETYLKCPKLFMYRHLAGLRERTNKNEHKAQLGQAVHQALQDFFTPLIGKDLTRSELDSGKLRDLLHQRITDADFFRSLPYDAGSALLAATSERMDNFLMSFPDTRIHALEKRAESLLETESGSMKLHGRLDRVDMRNGQYVILDYKTGTIIRPKKYFWDNDQLWEAMKAFQPGADPQAELLAELSEEIRGLQMPIYAHLWTAENDDPKNEQGLLYAGWVNLAENGREEMLLGVKMDDDQRQLILTERIPELLKFVAAHLLSCEQFIPIQGRQCQWCAYRGPCGA